MAKPYSLDLRERVVAAVAAGESCRAAAKRFAVSVSSVVKWSQRQRATGSAAAARMGGRRPFALAAERDFVLRRLTEKPDITLRALGAELAERGVNVSYFAVWHFCKREGLTFKKNAARQRAGSARRRPKTRSLAAPSRQT
jgi:putative transposase